MTITVVIVIAIIVAIFLYIGIRGSKKSKNNPVRDREGKQEDQKQPASNSSRLG